MAVIPIHNPGPDDTNADSLYEAANKINNNEAFLDGKINQEITDRTNALEALDNSKESKANKGVAGGYVGLDDDNLISASHLPVADFELVAAQDLERFRCIKVDGNEAHYASSDDDLAVTSGSVGISVNTPLLGEKVGIKSSGVISYAGWSFEPKKAIFVGIGGVMTQTMPSSGYIQLIGAAITATQIQVLIQPTIKLEF